MYIYIYASVCVFTLFLYYPLSKEMRDHHIERLLMQPFPFGCASDSSASVAKISQTMKLKIKMKMKMKKKRVSEENLPETRRKEENKDSPRRGRMRRVKVLMALPKAGMQRLLKGFKTFSLLFVYKEEEVNKEKEEELEREMEIGLPTDVKHLTHIGWDGSTTINPIKGWENLKAPEIMCFPSISLEQFELAMNSQTVPQPPPPLTT